MVMYYQTAMMTNRDRIKVAITCAISSSDFISTMNCGWNCAFDSVPSIFSISSMWNIKHKNVTVNYLLVQAISSTRTGRDSLKIVKFT